MNETDPLRDLENRIERLSALVDKRDALVSQEIEGIRRDVNALRTEFDKAQDEADDAHEQFVTLARYTPLEKVFWAAVTALIVAMIGGAVAILTSRGGTP